MTRLGLVADAAVAVLADSLAREFPRLPKYDIDRIAAAQVEALRADGWRITAPVTALARTRPHHSPGDDVTLTDTSTDIAVVLLGLALGLVVVVFLVSLRRARYQGPPSEPYAGFRTGARTERGGESLQLECEGHCPGTTAHQVTSDEEATCVLCGTPRSLLPGFAAVDDQA